jgi:hypothetical protein
MCRVGVSLRGNGSGSPLEGLPYGVPHSLYPFRIFSARLPCMKRILAPILLLTLLFPSLAYGVTMDDLVYRDGIHYKKFSTVPFTGKVTGKSQGSLKNGKWDGPWVRYHENGELAVEGSFRDGEFDGPWVSYEEDGTINLGLTGTFKNGVKVN